MASFGYDQFAPYLVAKPDDNTVTPQKKKVSYSQVSSMSSPQSTTVTKTSASITPAMQNAAKRKLKKMQDDSQVGS